DPCRAGQTGTFEVRAVGLVAGNGDELAPRAEAPPVVEAGHEAGVALGLAADHGTTVWARVEPDLDRAFGVAAEDQRPSRHAAGLEVVGFLQLGLVPDVEPDLVEDGLALFGQHVRVHHDLPVHTEARHL